MSKFTPQQLQTQFQKLPQVLKDTWQSEAEAEKLFQIGRAHGLTIEKTGFMVAETGYIILGLVRPSEFAQKLKERLDISSADAKKLALDINHKIFYPLREALKTTHHIEVGEPTIQQGSAVPTAKPTPPVSAPPVSTPAPNRTKEPSMPSAPPRTASPTTPNNIPTTKQDSKIIDKTKTTRESPFLKRWEDKQKQEATTRAPASPPPEPSKKPLPFKPGMPRTPEDVLPPHIAPSAPTATSKPAANETKPQRSSSAPQTPPSIPSPAQPSISQQKLSPINLRDRAAQRSVPAPHTEPPPTKNIINGAAPKLRPPHIPASQPTLPSVPPRESIQSAPVPPPTPSTPPRPPAPQSAPAPPPPPPEHKETQQRAPNMPSPIAAPSTSEPQRKEKENTATSPEIPTQQPSFEPDAASPKQEKPSPKTEIVNKDPYMESID